MTAIVALDRLSRHSKCGSISSNSFRRIRTLRRTTKAMSNRTCVLGRLWEEKLGDLDQAVKSPVRLRISIPTT
jgi:hypothetical protein